MNRSNKVRAIALCRVSTRGQELNGNLIPQVENVEKAANILGVELVKTWSLAVSSRKGKNINRVDLIQMHEYCKHDKSIKYLIVDEVDRFMRSIKEYYWWKVEFERLGVQIRFAHNPLVEPEEDRAIFDELIDVYRAEQSNNERITKTPEKQKARLRAGYYPSNPHTGYKKSEMPGLHIPDEPNWSAMRDSFVAMARGECSVDEGLKRALDNGLRTKNYGPKSVGGNKIDMYRWKELMVDVYYCGRLKFSDWDLGEDVVEGLHIPMISFEEHEMLVRLVKKKGNRFIIRKGGNPDYPLTTLAECAQCLFSEYKSPRLTSANQNTGKLKGYKIYKRYRCRACNLEVLRDVFHKDFSEELENLLLTHEQKDMLKYHARKIWKVYEKARIEKARIALGRLKILKEQKNLIVDSLLEAKKSNDGTSEDIKERLDSIKIEIVEAETVAVEAQNFEKDFEEFITFAIDFMDNLRGEWWKLDKQTMGIYKQMLFPAGILLLPNKKVYIPEISPIYLYKTQKSAPEEAEISSMEGPVGLEPTTPCLKGRCSNQLSYGPASELAALSCFALQQKLRLKPMFFLTKLHSVANRLLGLQFWVCHFCVTFCARTL